MLSEDASGEYPPKGGKCPHERGHLRLRASGRGPRFEPTLVNPSRYLAASLLVCLVVLASCGQEQASTDAGAGGGGQESEESQGDAGNEGAYGDDSGKEGQETEDSNGYGISGPDEGGATARSASIKVVDTAFKPGATSVKVTAKISWKQTGSQPHSVTATDESFDSNPKCSPLQSDDCMGAGDSFSFTFDEPGTYSYYCRVHGLPDGTGMVGEIKVE